MPRCSIPWVFNYYMQKKKKQGRSLLKPYSLDVKEVFMIYSENIQYHIIVIITVIVIIVTIIVNIIIIPSRWNPALSPSR